MLIINVAVDDFEEEHEKGSWLFRVAAVTSGFVILLAGIDFYRTSRSRFQMAETFSRKLPCSPIDFELAELLTVLYQPTVSYSDVLAHINVNSSMNLSVDRVESSQLKAGFDPEILRLVALLMPFPLEETEPMLILDQSHSKATVVEQESQQERISRALAVVSNIAVRADITDNSTLETRLWLTGHAALVSMEHGAASPALTLCRQLHLNAPGRLNTIGEVLPGWAMDWLHYFELDLTKNEEFTKREDDEQSGNLLSMFILLANGMLEISSPTNISMGRMPEKKLLDAIKQNPGDVSLSTAKATFRQFKLPWRPARTPLIYIHSFDESLWLADRRESLRQFARCGSEQAKYRQLRHIVHITNPEILVAMKTNNNPHIRILQL